ncbi:S41 family peptidase [Cytobacillus sp. FJAT-54145]|uniref:S41 family peptidase n=1 Tax=Cytobacillus spartinae TaxID=3299023 RepID=A0ABW6KHU0_9BACI
MANLKLTDTDKLQILRNLVEKVEKNYVYPEVAEEIIKNLNDLSNNQDLLNTLEDNNDYCKKVTDVLQSVNHDKHLRLIYKEHVEEKHNTDEDVDLFAGEWRKNFGFNKLEILPGNIGYINLTVFDQPSFAGNTAVAAMNFVSNTNGLILDLRKNVGGDPDMVSFLMSYFLNESVHNTTFYNRPTNREVQFWTSDFVPGKKYLDKPVYLLTSNFTFSAAESFAYNLKHLNKATIVGETTGGGANPGTGHKIHSNFFAFIPYGRAYHPETLENWEGVGVEPHIKVEKTKALDIAYKHLLTELLEKDDYLNDHLLCKEAKETILRLEVVTN